MKYLVIANAVLAFAVGCTAGNNNSTQGAGGGNQANRPVVEPPKPTPLDPSKIVTEEDQCLETGGTYNPEEKTCKAPFDAAAFDLNAQARCAERSGWEWNSASSKCEPSAATSAESCVAAGKKYHWISESCKELVELSQEECADFTWSEDTQRCYENAEHVACARQISSGKTWAFGRGDHLSSCVIYAPLNETECRARFLFWDPGSNSCKISQEHAICATAPDRVWRSTSHGGECEMTPRGRCLAGSHSWVNDVCRYDECNSSYKLIGYRYDGAIEKFEAQCRSTSASGRYVGAFALGANHTCANLSGELYCWGSSDFNQISDTASGSQTVQYSDEAAIFAAVNAGAPTSHPLTSSNLVSGFRDIYSITLGYGYSCIMAANRFRCLGLQWPDSRMLPPAYPAHRILAVSSQMDKSCAVTDGADAAQKGVSCWGWQVAADTRPPAAASRREVTRLSTRSDCTDVAVGDKHQCTVCNQQLFCSGNHEHGVLGNGQTTGATADLSRVGTLTGVLAVAAGTRHTCALIKRVPTEKVNSGGVLCWGSNDAGQLAESEMNSRTTVGPRAFVPGLEDFVTDIAAGEAHTCAVKTNGSLYCWGADEARQAGGDGETFHSVNRVIQGGNPVSGVVEVEAGARHTCYKTTDHKLYCFGSNAFGQLGRMGGEGTEATEVVEPSS